MDIKLDDKGGGFVIADTRDKISHALNNLENQANINEVRYDVDKEEVIDQINCRSNISDANRLIYSVRK